MLNILNQYELTKSQLFIKDFFHIPYEHETKCYIYAKVHRKKGLVGLVLEVKDKSFCKTTKLVLTCISGL